MGTAENGMSDPLTDDRLRKLSDEATRLAATVVGPLRSIRLRNGESSVELEWEFAGIWALDAGSGVEPNGSHGTASPTNSHPNRAGGPAAQPEPDERKFVRSPMVGTFYCAPAPGEPPFVTVGSTVEPDTVIGIVEAMKLMNQITAERHGVICEVLVSDKQPVEFDQPLVVVADLQPEHGG